MSTVQPTEDQRKAHPKSRPTDFERCAEQGEVGLLREFRDFLRYNKKWWLTPIVIVLLLIGAVLILGGTAAAPFIYTLF
jgi:hypothetical protein